MKYSLLLTLAAIAFLSTGCASVVSGTDQSITFEKEGYETYTAQLSTTTNPWFFGNIVIGGLLGSTTDGVSGAIHEFSPDQYFVTLKPDTPTGISTSKPRQIKEIIIAFSGEFRHQLASGGGEKVTPSCNCWVSMPPRKTPPSGH